MPGREKEGASKRRPQNAGLGVKPAPGSLAVVAIFSSLSRVAILSSLTYLVTRFKLLSQQDLSLPTLTLIGKDLLGKGIRSTQSRTMRVHKTSVVVIGPQAHCGPGGAWGSPS